MQNQDNGNSFKYPFNKIKRWVSDKITISKKNHKIPNILMCLTFEAFYYLVELSFTNLKAIMMQFKYQAVGFGSHTHP